MCNCIEVCDYDEEAASDDDPCYSFITDGEKEYLEGWLANKDNWVQMKGLGRGFEDGARFVPISGDGNCFFAACSTVTTASKALP